MSHKTSEAKITANRANGQKGGVKSPEGKAVSRFNAMRHGVLAKLISPYEQGFHDDFLQILRDEFQPASVIEEITLERLAIRYLQLYRLNLAEAEFMRQHVNEPRKESDLIKYSFTRVESEGYQAMLNSEGLEQLFSLYHRYSVSLENRLFKCMKQLKELRGASPE